MRLSECRPGEGGRIVGVSGDGRVGQRLLEMGFIEGAEVRVLRRAPLGDPIEIRLGGALLTLRRSEASFVEVGS